MTLMGTKKGHERQLSFLDAEVDNTSELPTNGDVAFSDPAFASNKLLPIHRWVPWIAGFSSDFVQKSLKSYLPGKGIVLDPFSGVGTTLVEATLAGHDVIGFEINPYAALACRIKLSAHIIDVASLRSSAAAFKAFYGQKTVAQYSPISVPPVGFRTRADFYSPQVLYKVLVIQDFINSIEDTVLKDIFKLSFAATMISYSNYSYEPSLARRVSSGKSDILDAPVFEVLFSKLSEMANDIASFQEHIQNRQLQVSIVNDTFFNYASYLESSSVDLIVTSPPYLNNYHYNRNTRPQLYWLGYAEKPEDLKTLEHANFGKYWQTVREKEYVGLDFSLPNSDIEERLNLLRTLHPEKKIYGGNGWANYAASYFNDCYKFATGISYCLKPGGTALVVLGNSILQGITIPTDHYFGQISELAGLKLVEIHIPRATRVGSSIIQSSVRVGKAKASQQLYEAVVELKKM